MLRKLRLLLVADEVRFWLIWAKNYSKNGAFATSHPNESFPPSRIAYDAYGSVDHENYYQSGGQSAAALASLIEGKTELSGAKILEWGCGPGRIVQQLERLLEGSGARLFACDYNRTSIQWCSSAIRGVTFAVNNLRPPLPFEDGFFDVVYSSSVFTHLSEEMHYAWLKENLRVLKRGGLLIFTTQGDRFRHKLLPSDLLQYEAGEIVVRTSKKEGKRSFSAFQSPKFIKKKFLSSVPGVELVRHETEVPFAGPQDVWIVRKS